MPFFTPQNFNSCFLFRDQIKIHAFEFMQMNNNNYLLLRLSMTSPSLREFSQIRLFSNPAADAGLPLHLSRLYMAGPPTQEGAHNPSLSPETKHRLETSADTQHFNQNICYWFAQLENIK